MTIKRVMKWGSILSGGILLLAMTALVLCAVFEVSLDLDGLRRKIDDALTVALGRDVNIEGSIQLVISLQPKLEIRQLRIANPSAWGNGDFARADRVRGQIDIIPLLGGKIRIGTIEVDQVAVSLETKSDGRNNWRFRTPGQADGKKAKAVADKGSGSVEFVELRKLALNSIVLIYKDGGLNRSYRFMIDALDGTAAAGEPIRLSLNGEFQKNPFDFTLEGGSLEDLMTPEKLWSANLSGKTGNSPLTVAVTAKPFDTVAEAAVEIEAKKVSLRGIFEELDISDSMELDVDRFVLRMEARGGNIREILEKSDIEISIENGRWFWPDPKNELDMTFTVNKSLIRSTAGNPIELSLDGAIQSDPFNVRLTGDPIAQLVTGDSPWNMQLSASFANANLSGNAALGRSEENPEVRYTLHSKNVDIGALLKQLNLARDIKAKVEAVEYTIVARGKTPSEMIEKSDLTIQIENAQYTLPSDAKSTNDGIITLQKGTIQSLAGQPVTIDVAGDITGQDKKKPYSLSITGDSLAGLVSGKQPRAFEMEGKFDKAPAKATIRFMRTDKTPEARIELETRTIDMGDTLNWLRVAEGIKADVGKMTAEITARGRSLQEMAIKSDVRLDVNNGSWQLKNPNMKSPVTVTISKLSLDRVSDKPYKLSTKGQLVKTVEKKRVPVNFEINATVTEKSSKNSTGSKAGNAKTPIHTLSVTGKISNSPFKLTGSVDHSKKIPKARLELTAKNLDLGGLFSWLEIAEGIESNAGALKMKINATGSDLEEILEKSDFRASLENGHWILQDRNTRAKTDIRVREGVVEAVSGKPVIFHLDGQLKAVPITIKLKTATLGAFSRKINRIPLDFDIRAAGARLNLTSEIPLPVTQENLEFKMSFSGKKLTSLGELLEVSLPPWGPYTLGGRFAINRDGYRVSDFEVHVGQSDLTGKAGLITKGDKPRLDIELTTNTLQINDFEIKNWSAVKKTGPGVERDGKAKKSGPRSKGHGERVKILLSPDVMTLLDSRLSLNVKNVLSGNDTLGSGSVLVKLKDGRLSIDPLELNIPGGSVNLSVAYHPTKTGVTGEVHTKIDKFDFGIPARRIKPDTKMNGLLSLYINLMSHAPGPNAFMHHVNGTIDLGIWPKDFEAGVFDLWAVNLLSSILPRVDKEKGSIVNCIIGHFSLTDGRMVSDKMAVDTTRMRVEGKSKADFKSRDVYMYLSPRGKKPEFFSLETPIEVKGKFSDFAYGVATGGLVGTVTRFITSPVHVPIRRLFSGDLPPEGFDLCAEPVFREKNRR